MRPTLYEFAGGEPAFLALAAAHHQRCLADPELNHPFSHPGQHPQHVARLGWYWAEVLGGPPLYTEHGGVQTSLALLHAHHGDLGELPQRFLRCFVAAMDDVGLPDDTEFRAAMTAYMEWAISDMEAYTPIDATVPDKLSIPRWSWDGLQRPPA